MAILALAVVPALILETKAVSQDLVAIAVTVNWGIWIGFVAEYLRKLALAPDRRGFVRRAWFDRRTRTVEGGWGGGHPRGGGWVARPAVACRVLPGASAFLAAYSALRDAEGNS